MKNASFNQQHEAEYNAKFILKTSNIFFLTTPILRPTWYQVCWFTALAVLFIL